MHLLITMKTHISKKKPHIHIQDTRKRNSGKKITRKYQEIYKQNNQYLYTQSTPIGKT